MKWLVKWFGYGLLGCVAFVWFLYWTFPYGQLKGWLEGQINTALGGGLQVSVGEVAPSWGTGLHIAALQLTDPQAAGKAATVLKVPDVWLRFGLLRTLFGHPAFSYTLALDPGMLSGSATWRDGGLQLTSAWEQVSTGLLQRAIADTGLQLAGTMDGTVALAANLAQWRNATGTLELQFKNWHFAKGSKLKLGAFGDLDLDAIAPNLKLSTGDGSHLECEMAKGTVSVTTLQLVGGDLEVKLTGKIYLENVGGNSRVNLKGTVKFSDSLKSNLPLQLLGPADPNDGSFPLELTGRLNKLVKRVGTQTL